LTQTPKARLKEKSFVWPTQKRFCDAQQIEFIANFLFADRFLYWRVCCYVCTREPKKKKRQMLRRETYRQQQQLALQERPGYENLVIFLLKLTNLLPFSSQPIPESIE
jgi:hypothetical protein